MVSAPHEAMHRIFQEHPELFSRVAEVLGFDFAPPVSATVLPTDLTEIQPVERRVDTLLRLETEDDEPLILAIESQGDKDPRKPASWAYYAAFLLAKYQLQPILLIVCQDRATAEWAARPVTFGPRQWPLITLRPLVAGPHNMPLMTKPAEVRKNLQLATLAAITHGKNRDIGAILKAMTTVLRDETDDVKNPIIEFISQGLGKLPAAAQWRTLVAVDLSFYKSPLFEEVRDEARAKAMAEGLAEGLAEGQAKGLAEGQAKGLAEGELQRAAGDVLTVLTERGIDVPEDARERITGCGDLEALSRWLRRAVTAPSAAEIFETE
ncbi:hypothetical protein [Streptomyces turgidiscabies]|uniref:Transposase YdaD n=1 Tax=Streptomyces turgidiscabies TaxID=85558 RepID=A0ABU0RRX6_9ACTN|nr:hypothetical protein [Streptomyces turgidiscabies]MDQ0933887.1 putative transposase YdaD [Streptomyces turgidiscabies]